MKYVSGKTGGTWKCTAKCKALTQFEVDTVLEFKSYCFEYLVYYIGYSLRGTTVSVATYPLTMRSTRGGTLGWNIEIY